MKKIILVLSVIVTFVSCKSEKKVENGITIGDFNFSSKEITQNEPFTITYVGTGNLENSFYHKIQHNKAFPDDLTFVENKATITIADSISGVAFNFKIDNKYNHNNKKGFLFKVKDKSGNLISDSQASLAYYTMTYGEQFGLESDPKEILNTLDETLDTNPKLIDNWYQNHIYLANEVDIDKGKTIGNNYISHYSSKTEMTLKDYEALSNTYRALRDKAKADSIISFVSKKYPESDLALRSKIDAFFEVKELSTKEALFASNKDRILNSDYANYIVRALAMEHFNKGNTEAFYNYTALMKNNTDKASLFNSIAWPNAEKGQNLEIASELSLKSLSLIEAEQKELKEKPDYYSPNQYKNSLENSYNMYADTYALLAFKKGDLKAAIKYQAKAVSKNSNPEMNECYIEFLVADQQYDKAIEIAKTYIEEGNSTAKLKTYFKEALSKSDNKTNPETLIADLEAKAKQKELDNLRKTLLDEDAIDFTLKNLDGEEITLSSLVGKTVVLDFWATWCGPCIQSFPGMQKVVDKYKDNENVEFFFVDTFEDGETRLKDVAKFIEDNDYNFNVLIDPKEENSTKYKVANAYKISGIPTKIIIGPSGKIKFKSVGYSGSAEKIVSEIDAMVALLKTNP
ncbi:TlpA disulfide reductase family protein [Winogradskyella algicola]|uniref:TlpA disulfide reductase family protein n=1 Tax=Winogradskyella algicola TaxID=2575815 RepID=UPI001109AAA9|nr:TlpA disulfide reductase family protein [Winogradskyella algicola]